MCNSNISPQINLGVFCAVSFRGLTVCHKCDVSSFQVDHSFDEMPPLPPRLSGPGVELPLTIRYGESLTIRVDVDGKLLVLVLCFKIS